MTVGRRLRNAAIGGAVLVAMVSALGTNYEHDGRTTYCWAIPRKTNETKLTEMDRVPGFSGIANCPLQMSIELSNVSVFKFAAVRVKWTVVADFTNGNAINNTKLYYGRDAKGVAAQIVHSNVHSCVYGTGCDPFNDGQELIDKTVNKVANFSDNRAVFNDSMTFPTTGEYSILTHIILPDTNVSRRFDYAVYTKLTVLDPATAAAVPPTASPTPPVAIQDNTSTGGWSTGTTVGVVLGSLALIVALALIAVLLWRRSEHRDQARGRYETTSFGDSISTKHSDASMPPAPPAEISAVWGIPIDTVQPAAGHARLWDDDNNSYATRLQANGGPADSAVNPFSSTSSPRSSARSPTTNGTNLTSWDL